MLRDEGVVLRKGKKGRRRGRKGQDVKKMFREKVGIDEEEEGLRREKEKREVNEKKIEERKGGKNNKIKRDVGSKCHI